MDFQIIYDTLLKLNLGNKHFPPLGVSMNINIKNLKLNTKPLFSSDFNKESI